MAEQQGPQSILRAFEAALPADPLVQRRKMFGAPAAFVNGNMFAAAGPEGVVVRLPPLRVAEALAAGAGLPFAPLGRRLRGFLLLPPALVADHAQLVSWLLEAMGYGLSLPPKEPRPRRHKRP